MADVKNYLITGGAGFIGSNFCDYLLKQEPDAGVKVLDKLTYCGNPANLRPFDGIKNFEFIQGDINDKVLLSRVVDEVNVVVNFAAESAVDRSIENPDEFLNTDIYGVYTLMEVLKESPTLERFIQISTDEVYGHRLEGSFNEESECKPRNPYSASKLGGERLAYSYFETYDLPVVITRASNNYGPRCYPEKIIPLFVTNLIEGLEVPIYGDGKHVRDWLYVKDHCSAIYKIIKDGINGEVYNVAGEQEKSNAELTKLILSEMGKDESSIKYVEDRPGHDLRYSIDSSKLKSLGWTPSVTLEEGLKTTIQWYKENEFWWKPLREKMDKKYVTGFWGEKD